jgi:hypothetical protein
MSQEFIPDALPEANNSHLARVLQVIEQMGLSSDPNERIAQMGITSGEGILHIATTLHTVLAPENDHTPTTYTMHIAEPDGSNRRHLTEPSERAVIFDKAASYAHTLSSTGESAHATELLGRIGNVVALAIVLAHPFEDGNGRTARTVAQLIREGYDGSDEQISDLKILGSNRVTNQGFRMFSFVPTADGRSSSPDEILAAAASVDIPLGENKTYVARKQRMFTSPFAD